MVGEREREGDFFGGFGSREEGLRLAREATFAGERDVGLGWRTVSFL